MLYYLESPFLLQTPPPLEPSSKQSHGDPSIETDPFRLSPSFFPGRNPHSARGCKPLKARNDLLFSMTHNLNYSANEFSSSLQDDCNPNPPQEAVLKAISEVSKVEGRVGQTTNLVMGGTVHDDSTNEWLVLDKKIYHWQTV
ncbi:unnamed protein product [Cuscuta europaea]|uniref:Uncharacterized protein n=1 Tax=Cuscuta europaea TaxID=41803 RepID=A0A9P0ZS19_CUSEU|nr:unnamed protein product [Cuscuta europaea]